MLLMEKLRKSMIFQVQWMHENGLSEGKEKKRAVALKHLGLLLCIIFPKLSERVESTGELGRPC